MSYWKKLRRVLQYAKSTANDKRIIGASGIKDIFIFGVFHVWSSKQILKTKGSTETELVGVSEYGSFNIWALNFLHDQGYELEKTFCFRIIKE